MARLPLAVLIALLLRQTACLNVTGDPRLIHHISDDGSIATLTFQVFPWPPAEDGDATIKFFNGSLLCEMTYESNGTFWEDLDCNRQSMGRIMDFTPPVSPNVNFAFDIKDISEWDDALYTMVVSFPTEEFLATTHLIIYDTLSAEIAGCEEGDMHAMENDTLKLTCVAEGIPGPIYTWLHNGKLQLSSRGELLKENMPKEDTGTYACLVDSQIVKETARKECQVHVQYPPIVSVFPEGPLSVKVGQALNLSCDADSLPTSKEFLWMLGNKPLSLGRYLHLKKVSVSDDGTYTCFVTNLIKIGDEWKSFVASESVIIAVQQGAPTSSGPDLAAILTPTIILGVLSIVGGILACCYRKRKKDNEAGGGDNGIHIKSHLMCNCCTHGAPPEPRKEVKNDHDNNSDHSGD